MMTEAETSGIPLGARLGDGRCCTFGVWAPHAERVDLHLVAPHDATIAMTPHPHGYFKVAVDDVAAGARYYFRLDGGEQRADPASRHQPDGVHGPSAVVPTAYEWTDARWRGPRLDRYVLYELHTGTFTPEGTFTAIVPRLPALADLGITAIELMPVAQFPGTRNWGYDGVFPFAVQHSYGGPAALKALVAACHAAGIAVVLDVVYNHLGPEGSYLGEFGPYFSGRYLTPWGGALNVDGAHSDEVRRFFIENALQWVDEFHIDALRLDAIHAILDTSARPFLQELADAVHERARRLERNIYLIGESDLGDPRIIRPAELGGHGLDAQWSDDFHHALHAVLTGEQHGYYADFGEPEQVAASFRDGYVFTGQYSRFRARRHGALPAGIPPAQLVVFDQNHDQIGNRLNGDRLCTIVDFERCKVAAAAVALSPFTPLLFMGEEYGDRAPFPYFVSHSDAELVDAVRRGRHEEFAAFEWQGRPPDPQAEETFSSAILDWQLRDRAEHAAMLAVYRTLLTLRRQLPVLTSFERIEADVVGSAIAVHRRGAEGEALLTMSFAEGARLDLPDGDWRVRFDSASAEWDGPGDARPVMVAGSIALRSWSAVLLTR
jgi:maltooligosyltrehalose trehalohydrolase